MNHLFFAISFVAVIFTSHMSQAENTNRFLVSEVKISIKDGNIKFKFAPLQYNVNPGVALSDQWVEKFPGKTKMEIRVFGKSMKYVEMDAETKLKIYQSVLSPTSYDYSTTAVSNEHGAVTFVLDKAITKIKSDAFYVFKFNLNINAEGSESKTFTGQVTLPNIYNDQSTTTTQLIPLN